MDVRRDKRFRLETRLVCNLCTAYDEDSDTLTVEYTTEPGCIYTIDLTSYFHHNKICLLKPVI